ncbi:hypothetical protein DUT91_16655 [Phyllobacterium salinisoli]|uniref:Uncharacterized protein n=1 Tax=Phyllobacterium salinisoli TaxID=1899321 RepID=A0A368K400_9HYPH|nr:hypothetical protein DUT91_16655 [Phyllobacterium salinisoli]
MLGLPRLPDVPCDVLWKVFPRSVFCPLGVANRIGHTVYSTSQLKTIQEVITLTVFVAFSVLYLKVPLTWRHDTKVMELSDI